MCAAAQISPQPAREPGARLECEASRRFAGGPLGGRTARRGRPAFLTRGSGASGMTEIVADAALRAPPAGPARSRRRSKRRRRLLDAAPLRLWRRGADEATPARGTPAAPALDPRDFEGALVALFARGRRACAPMTCALSVAFAFVAATLIAPAAALAWLCAALAAQLAALAAASGLDREPSARAARRRGAALVAAEAMVGASFALVVALVGCSGEPGALACAVVMALFACATRAGVSPTLPLAVAAGAAPCALVLAALPGWAGDGATQALALALAAQLCFLALARRLYRGALGTLSMQADKDELIAELEQAKAGSDLARRRAEEASLAKSHFLATMSHELRTPLNAILGFSEVMKGELFGAHVVASYKEYSHDIHESGQHLLTLINEILDLSRIEAGRFELKEEPVALAHIVEDCRHLLALRARKRAITIDEAVEPDLPRLRADERAVRQMALNLLSNAVKFTPPGGRVEVRVGWTASGGQYFAVRDTGPGVPEEEIPTVMASFGRGALARKHAEEGSGLGLPIVKGLAELHGGRFMLRSAPGGGAEAAVIFPSWRVLEPGEQEEDVRAARRRRKARREAASAA